MIYFQKKGSGEPLILLHSGGMTSNEWEPQVPFLEARFSLFLPDLPGHGQSVTNEKITIELMANSVIEMMDHNHLKTANILGSSMGGAVALWIAIHHPDRINKLIIYRIGYEKNQATYLQTKQMADPAYWQKYGMHKWLSKIHEPQGGLDAWKKVIENVSKIMDPSISQHKHLLTDLQTIKHSTLLIAGDRDPIIPLETIFKMHQMIANSGLWIMPFATHITGTNTWRSNAFAKEVSRFILFKK